MRVINKLDAKAYCFLLFFTVATIWMIRYSSTEWYNYFALMEVIFAIILVTTELNQKMPIRHISVLMRLLFFISISGCLILVLSPDKLLDMKYLGVQCVYFSPIIHFQWLQKKTDNNLRKALLFITYYIWGYYGLKQLLFYTTHTMAARHLAANPLYYGKIAIGGGYFFAYGSAVLAVYLLERICFVRRRLGLVILCIICIAHVLMTESTLTTMAMLLGIGLVLLKVIARKMHMKLISIILMGLIGVGIIVFSGAGKLILLEIYDYFSGVFRPYAWRIMEIIDFLLGRGVVKEGAIESRWIVYKDSIDKILKQPLLGELLNGRFFEGGGGHSEVLDVLAQWGIPIGGLYLSIYMESIRITYKQSSCKIYIIPIIWMILLNPVAIFHFSFVAFLMIPLQQMVDREMIVCV